MKIVPLTDICDFQGGTQPPKNEWSKYPTDQNVRMLQIRDFTQPDKEHIEYVQRTKKLKFCNDDDILIGRYGASIGKILTGLSGAYNVAIIKTIPNKELLSGKFLFHLFKGPKFQAFINGIGARAAQAGFNKTDLSKFNVPLLPIDGQIRIATLLSRVEALIATRKDNLRLLDEFLKSTFLEMFGDPVRNDRGWKTEYLGNIAKVERGRFSPRPRNDPKYFNGDFPFIQTGDISRANGRLHNYSQTLNELGIKVSKEFKKNTVVIAIVGATIGETALLRINTYAPDSVIGITPTSEAIDSIYLEFLLRFWKPTLKANAPEAARANININTLKPLAIILPSAPLPKNFVLVANKIEYLKTLYQQSLNELENLYGTLSQKAFKGELDLSRIPLEKEIGETVFDPTADSLDRITKPVALMLPDPTDRDQLLRQLFDTFITERKGASFSLDDFWTQAEQKVMDHMDEESRPLGIADYDKAKAWLFDLLKSGEVEQRFNEENNRMELNIRK